MKKKDLEIFIEPPHIETERLLLSKITSNDMEDVFEYASDTAVSEFLLWEPHKSKDYTKEYLEYLDYLYSKKRFFDWAIRIKSTNKMIGTCGFSKFYPLFSGGSIGYVLNSKFWKNGYASEAVDAILSFGFKTLKLPEISAEVMADNSASIRLLYKLGFTKSTRTYTMRVKGKTRTVFKFVMRNEDFSSE